MNTAFEPIAKPKLICGQKLAAEGCSSFGFAHSPDGGVTTVATTIAGHHPFQPPIPMTAASRLIPASKVL